VSTQQRFADEQDPEGNPWPPSIRALMFGGKTLTDQAILRNSITHNVFGDGVEVGSDLIYAAVHQFGATITAKTDQGLMFKIGDQFVRKDSVTLPARAYLGVDAEDEAAIVQILEDHLGEPLGVTP
jgi:phage gpG-like protein